jgi:hypothetical protein
MFFAVTITLWRFLAMERVQRFTPHQHSHPLSACRTGPVVRKVRKVLSAGVEETTMFMTIAIVLLVAWLLGLFVFKVTAGLIHLILVVAVILFVLHFLRGRKV